MVDGLASGSYFGWEVGEEGLMGKGESGVVVFPAIDFVIGVSLVFTECMGYFAQGCSFCCFLWIHLDSDHFEPENDRKCQ